MEQDIKPEEYIETLKLETQRFLSTLSREDLYELKDYEFDEELSVEWLQYGLFVDNLMNIKGLSMEDFARTVSLAIVVEQLKAAGFFAASYNYIGIGEVPEHTDEDLCGNAIAIRAFIPIVDSEAYFTGYTIDPKTGTADYVEDYKLNGQPIYLDPCLNHKLVQKSDNGHYIIADIVYSKANEEDVIEYKKYAVATYS